MDTCENQNVNKILVVGNGFDLACGLKTGFTDFMAAIFVHYFKYLENCSSNTNSSNRFKQAIDELKLKYSFKFKINFVKADKRFFENIFFKLLLHGFYPDVYLLYILSEVNKNRISEYKFHECNEILNYFLGLKFNDLFKKNEYKWLDVEKLIGQIVSDNFNYYTIYNSVLDKAEKDEKKGIKSITNILPLYSEFVRKYLITNNNIDLVECFSGLKLFVENFNQYLHKVTDEKICEENIPKKLMRNNRYTHCLSFNYTSTFVPCLISYFISCCNVSYVHGSLNDNNIVIGTESIFFCENSRDESDINKMPFFKFFQRVLLRTDNNYLNWINSNNFYELTFYGFSFSQSDFDLIRELFVSDKYNSNSGIYGEIRKNLKMVTIFYYKSDSEKFRILVNLALCLGKRNLLELQSKLKFEIAD